jgi:hypothetical protein
MAGTFHFHTSVYIYFVEGEQYDYQFRNGMVFTLTSTAREIGRGEAFWIRIAPLFRDATVAGRIYNEVRKEGDSSLEDAKMGAQLCSKF